MAEHMSIRDVFLQSQAGLQCHAKLIKKLSKVFSSMDIDSFWSQFVSLLKFPMVVYTKEPSVEATIDFITTFVTALLSEKSACSEDKCNILLQKIFNFLLTHHDSKDKAVRFRVCHLINKLLVSMGDEASIDDSLYDRIFECMLTRLRDRVSAIRCQAVLALVRLQEPNDDSCPVMKAFCFLMTCDPSAEVRKAVVLHMALCRQTLPAILERTRDVKEAVRHAAFSVISDKVPVKALTIEQRIQLLRRGLTDQSESVKRVVSGKLLQAWLSHFQGNVLELMHCLDVESSVDICHLVLTNLFGNSTVTDLVKGFTLCDNQRLVPREKLTCESSMYWQELCCYVSQAGPEYEAQLDTVLPDCLQFCSYFGSIMEEMSTCQELDTRLDLEFIVQQLLKMFTSLDLSDQACRKQVMMLLHSLVLSDDVRSTLVTHVLRTLWPLYSSVDSFVGYVAEAIAEICQPISVIEKSIGEDEKRKLDVQAARVRVQLHQAREQLEECVRNQEFQQAAELKEAIICLESERSLLIASLQPASEDVRIEKDIAVIPSNMEKQTLHRSINSSPAVCDFLALIKRMKLQQRLDLFLEYFEGINLKDTPTVTKCLTIVCEMLDILPLEDMIPTIQMMLENQILPGMANTEASVRNLAVKAMGMCCYLKCDIIAFHLPILIQASQVDVECVRVTAVKSIFDIIHIHGLGAFVDEAVASFSGRDDCKGVDDEGDKTTDIDGNFSDIVQAEACWSKTASNLILILSSMLDNEGGELQCAVVEGLSKLMLSRRLSSASLLSRLLLLWFNPLEEENLLLRHILATFFSVFAFTDIVNMQLFEEAFMPTLRTILNAPSTSPLSGVDVNNVATFLIEMTHVHRIVSTPPNRSALTKDNVCHDNLAMKVCNEIITNPQSFQLRLWLRILTQLSISPDNRAHIKNLSVLCGQMLQVVKEKACVKSIEKFQKTVTDLLEDMSIGQSVQLEQQSKVVSENCDVLGCVLRTSTDGTSQDPDLL